MPLRRKKILKVKENKESSEEKPMIKEQEPGRQTIQIVIAFQCLKILGAREIRNWQRVLQTGSENEETFRIEITVTSSTVKRWELVVNAVVRLNTCSRGTKELIRTIVMNIFIAKTRWKRCIDGGWTYVMRLYITLYTLFYFHDDLGNPKAWKIVYSKINFGQFFMEFPHYLRRILRKLEKRINKINRHKTFDAI